MEFLKNTENFEREVAGVLLQLKETILRYLKFILSGAELIALRRFERS